MRNPNDGFQKYWISSVSALTLSSVLLAGCAINRPVDTLAEGCRLPAEVITVAITDDSVQQGIVRTNQSGPVGNALLAIARSKAASQGINSGLTRNLVLSGGGQHGSFGSGFLKGMQDGGTFPRYDVVTGVSTGALQATFALLGRESPPTDRTLNVSDDFPANANARPRTNLDDLVAGYTITREATLYNEKGTNGIIRKAAKGNLEPLTVRLDRLITEETLKAVKAAYDNGRGRRLFVALLNYESGNTEIVDMTALADRLDGTNFAQIQHCYNQVLLAASSEPIGAPPVVIDRKLYFDAGLRYGVFLKQFLGDVGAIAKIAARLRGTPSASPAPAIQTDIIVNGDLNVDPSGDKFAIKFSALDIAGRGRKILVNQVYRFSVSEVIKPRGTEHNVRFASIRVSEINAGPPAPGATFDPAYMARMIALGKQRGSSGDWQAIAELSALQ